MGSDFERAMWLKQSERDGGGGEPVFWGTP